MGSRGPLGSIHGRRAIQRNRKLKIVSRMSPKAPRCANLRIPIPPEVRRNEAARKFWNQHKPVLQFLGRLQVEYRASFARLCLAHARAEDYRKRIEQDGAILTGPRGAQIKHPLLTALRQAEATFTQLADKFGLDPKSAQRLPTVAEAAASRRDRLLADGDDWRFFDEARRPCS